MAGTERLILLAAAVVAALVVGSSVAAIVSEALAQVTAVLEVR